jgi:hypothetical protein
VLRQMIDEVMFDIQAMTGQEYVDEYASKKPESIPAAPPAAVPAVDLAAHAAGNGSDEAEGGERRSSADALARWNTA